MSVIFYYDLDLLGGLLKHSQQTIEKSQKTLDSYFAFSRFKTVFLYQLTGTNFQLLVPDTDQSALANYWPFKFIFINPYVKVDRLWIANGYPPFRRFPLRLGFYAKAESEMQCHGKSFGYEF